MTGFTTSEAWETLWNFVSLFSFSSMEDGFYCLKVGAPLEPV